jgi:hypothetical protein
LDASISTDRRNSTRSVCIKACLAGKFSQRSGADREAPILAFPEQISGLDDEPKILLARIW